MNEIINCSKNTLALAKEFSELLISFLTYEQMNEVIEKNRSADYSGTCASHDYCDSNQLMIDAFENLYKRSINVQSEEDNELINHAWNFAKLNSFFPRNF